MTENAPEQMHFHCENRFKNQRRQEQEKNQMRLYTAHQIQSRRNGRQVLRQNIAALQQAQTQTDNQQRHGIGHAAAFQQIAHGGADEQRDHDETENQNTRCLMHDSILSISVLTLGTNQSR